MSALYNNRSHDQDGQRAAELHDNAAHAQRSDAQARDKQEHGIQREFSRRTLEHARQASEHTGLARRCPANEDQIPVLGITTSQCWHIHCGKHGAAPKDRQTWTGFSLLVACVIGHNSPNKVAC
jgi:hypothetical protein